MFRRRGRQIRVALSREDTELLQQVVREYLDLLDADPEPGDPVIARLYPSASLDDPAQWPLAVLHYLGSLQESLVAALNP